jgi:hypothetical protein
MAKLHFPILTNLTSQNEFTKSEVARKKEKEERNALLPHI